MKYNTGLKLPERIQKPRSYGENMIIEKGITYDLFQGYINDYHEIIDYVKFTSGIGVVDARIKDKIAICTQHQIPTFFGGSLFEKFYAQEKIAEYVSFLKHYSIPIVEISNGITDIDLPKIAEAVQFFKKQGFTVFTEIGSKDTDFVMPPSTWIREINNALDAGADKLIMEGRESGTAGLYRGSGEIRTGLLEEIYNQTDINKVIFEAPNKNAQCYLINTFGCNVNLGNLKFEDINMVEVQRLGLRYDTFGVQK